MFIAHAAAPSTATRSPSPIRCRERGRKMCRATLLKYRDTIRKFVSRIASRRLRVTSRSFSVAISRLFLLGLPQLDLRSVRIQYPRELAHAIHLLTAIHFNAFGLELGQESVQVVNREIDHELA